MSQTQLIKESSIPAQTKVEDLGYPAQINNYWMVYLGWSTRFSKHIYAVTATAPCVFGAEQSTSWDSQIPYAARDDLPNGEQINITNEFTLYLPREVADEIYTNFDGTLAEEPGDRAKRNGFDVASLVWLYGLNCNLYGTGQGAALFKTGEISCLDTAEDGSVALGVLKYLSSTYYEVDKTEKGNNPSGAEADTTTSPEFAYTGDAVPIQTYNSEWHFRFEEQLAVPSLYGDLVKKMLPWTEAMIKTFQMLDESDIESDSSDSSSSESSSSDSTDGDETIDESRLDENGCLNIPGTVFRNGTCYHPTGEPYSPQVS